MLRNYTTVSTASPVKIHAYLRNYRETKDVAFRPPDLEFEIDGRLVATRPLRALSEAQAVEALLADPVRLHLMMIEDGDLSLRGMLFVIFPVTDAGKSWMPSPFLASPDSMEEEPPCFPLGEVSIEATLRDTAELIDDAKGVLEALSSVAVTDATERAIDTLLAEAANAA